MHRYLSGGRLSKGRTSPKTTRTLLAAALSICFSAGAFAAPGTPSLSEWEITSKSYGFVQVDLQAAVGGSPAYKDVVKLNKSVDVPLPFDIHYNGNAVKAVAVIDGQEDVSSAIQLSPNGAGTQKGSVTAHPDAAGRHQMQVRVYDASGAMAESKPLEIAVFDTTPQLADDLPNNVDPKNKPYVNSTNSVVGTYFATWGVYGRNFDVSKVPVENLTHILYGFVPICSQNDNQTLASENPGGFQALVNSCQGLPEYSVTIHDMFAEIGKQLPGQEAKSPLKGVLGQMMAAKKRNPNLKILPSIGGWTLSDPFFKFDDASKRKVFVDSVENFLRTWKFFDGVDIDWEFPGGKGANPNLGKPSDGPTYVTLMKELRGMLDNLSKETGRKYELTSAIGAGQDKISVVNYADATKYMDYIFDMTYDFYGAWSKTDLGHQTALHAPKWRPDTAYTTANSIQALLDQGVDPDKLVVGVAKYGRGWTGVNGYQGDNPFTGTATGPIPGTWESGILDYKDMVAKMIGPNGQGINGFTYHYDADAEAPYLFNKSTGDLVTYDDARSTIAKGKFAKEKQLGGVFSWEIDADNGDLLNAMHEGLGHQSGEGPVNHAPVANAGGDKTVEVAGSVMLDGSSSYDPNGKDDIKSYKWEQISGSPLTLSNATSARAQVQVPEVAQDTTYQFKLTVTDNEGLSSSATMKLTAKAKAPQPDNKPPVANAGVDQVVQAPGSVTLDGSASNDPDGTIASYKWEQVSGSPLTLNNATSAQAQVQVPEVAQDTTYQFKLTVTDNEGLSSNATMKLTAKAKGGDSEYPAYEPGKAYQGGEIVTNHGKLYQCKPYPQAGWCGQAPTAYEPGKGWAWTDAWNEVK